MARSVSSASHSALQRYFRRVPPGCRWITFLFVTSLLTLQALKIDKGPASPSYLFQSSRRSELTVTSATLKGSRWLIGSSRARPLSTVFCAVLGLACRSGGRASSASAEVDSAAPVEFKQKVTPFFLKLKSLAFRFRRVGGIAFAMLPATLSAKTSGKGPSGGSHPEGNSGKERLASPERDLMRSQWMRVASFANFPSEAVSALYLAAAGFYATRAGDEVACFSCGVRHGGWTPGDVPRDLHSRMSPSCPFLQSQDPGAPIPQVTESAERELSRLSGVPFRGRGRPQSVWDVPSSSVTERVDSGRVPSVSEDQDSSLGVGAGESPVGLAQPLLVADGPSALESDSLATAAYSPCPSQSEVRRPVQQQGQLNYFERHLQRSQQQQQQNQRENQQHQHQRPHQQQQQQNQMQIQQQRQHQQLQQQQQQREQQRQQQQQREQQQLQQQQREQQQLQQQQREQQQLQQQQQREQQQREQEQQQQQQQGASRLAQQQRETQVPGASGLTESSSVQDLLNICVARPQYPPFALLVKREESFARWPVGHPQRVDRLADAGFFYCGQGDGVRCFNCNGGLKNWEATDDPWIEHARWFPRCTYIRQCKGDNFVMVVRELIDDESLTMEKVEQKLKDMEKETRGELKELVTDAPSSEELANDATLVKDLERMREQTRCKICLEKEVSILFLPCAHLVACPQCAPALPKCPICRKSVKATVKVYMS